MNNLINILKKIRPVTPNELQGKTVSVHGIGQYADEFIQKFSLKVISHYYQPFEEKKALLKYKNKAKPANEAQGEIVILASRFEYRYSQLLSLTESNIDKINEVYIIDPYKDKRVIRSKKTPNGRSLIVKLGYSFPNYFNILTPLQKYLSLNNHDIGIVCPLLIYHFNEFIESDNIIYWGGSKDAFSTLDNLIESNKITYLEAGFFPQSEYYYFDKKGTNHNSSLMDDDLRWVTEKHITKLNHIRKSFLGNFIKKPGKYILIPLQVPTDANIIKASRFKNGMQDFIDYICDYYPKGTNLLFKPHPKDPDSKYYTYHGHQSSTESFISLLPAAIKVHGITSSTLYEAALAGCEVISEGDSLLNQHKNATEKLLAAIVDRQIHISENKLDYWINRYSKIKL